MLGKGLILPLVLAAAAVAEPREGRRVRHRHHVPNGDVLRDITGPRHAQMHDGEEEEILVTALDAPVGGRNRTCSSCVDRELFKNFTREEIKERILRKLGMSSPPNVTASQVPAQLVRQLLSRYRRQLDALNDEEMQNDDAGGGGEDDFHFQTRQINVIAQDRE